MRELNEGETFIVTSTGVPVGELTPSRRQRFVSAESVVEAFKGAPDIEAGAFRVDIDRYLDQSIQPRG